MTHSLQFHRGLTTHTNNFTIYSTLTKHKTKMASRDDIESAILKIEKLLKINFQ